MVETSLEKAKLSAVTWRKRNEDEYSAHQEYGRGNGACVGKITRSKSGNAWWFNVSAWGGHEKQSADGYMPTVESAKAVIELILNAA